MWLSNSHTARDERFNHHPLHLTVHPTPDSSSLKQVSGEDSEFPPAESPMSSPQSESVTKSPQVLPESGSNRALSPSLEAEAEVFKGGVPHIGTILVWAFNPPMPIKFGVKRPGATAPVQRNGPSASEPRPFHKVPGEGSPAQLRCGFASRGYPLKYALQPSQY